MSLITAADRQDILDDITFQSSKAFSFKKADRDIYKKNKDSLGDLGFAFKDLQKEYKDYDFVSRFGAAYKFGTAVKDLPDELFFGTKTQLNSYLDARTGALNDLIKLLQGAQSPEDLNKVIAVLEQSRKAAGDDSASAAHYLEMMAAAKAVLAKDEEGMKAFRKYDKSFLLSGGDTIPKVIEELVSRRDALQEIQTGVYGQAAEHGIAGNMSDGAMKFVGQTTTAATVAPGLYKGIRYGREASRAIKTYKALEQTHLAGKSMIKKAGGKFINEAQKLAYKESAKRLRDAKKVMELAVKKSGWMAKTVRGTTGLFKGAGSKLMGLVRPAFTAMPLPAKLAVGALAAVGIAAFAAKAYVAHKNNPDWHEGISDFAYSTFVGNTGGYVQTALSYVIPDVTGLIGGEKYSMYGKWSFLPSWMNYSNEAADSTSERLVRKFKKDGEDDIEPTSITAPSRKVDPGSPDSVYRGGYLV